jgi:PAS domain S-box-containing protein
MVSLKRAKSLMISVYKQNPSEILYFFVWVISLVVMYIFNNRSTFVLFTDLLSVGLISVLAISNIIKSNNSILDTKNKIYDDLLDLSSDGIIVLNPEAQIIKTNHAIEEMLGYSSEELSESNFYPALITKKEDIALVMDQFKLGRQNFKNKNQIKIDLVKKDRSFIKVELSINCVFNKQKKIVGFVCLISDKIFIKDSLRISQTVLENMQEGVLTFDKAGFCIYSNKSNDKLFEMPHNEFLGKHHSEMFIYPSKVEYANIECILEKLKHGESFTGEFIRQTKTGNNFPALIKVTKERLDNDIIYIILTEDLTEKKKKEDEFIEQQSKIISIGKLSELGEIASGIAHEINNPLSVISNINDLIAIEIETDSLNTTELSNYNDKINAMVFRINKIVKNLKKFARDGSDSDFENASLEEIVTDSTELCSTKYKNHDIELIIDPIPKSIQIECRPVQISQVLVNLLNNAFDAIQTLPQPRWIKITCEELNPDQIQLAVTDSGLGVPDNLREKIMQPFFTTKEIGKGTGLGLSLSKNILETHGGKLTLDPKSPNTKFCLILNKKQTGINKDKVA